MTDRHDDYRPAGSIHFAIVIAAATVFVGALMFGIDWDHLLLAGAMGSLL